MDKLKKIGENIKNFIFNYDLEIIFLKGITHISFSIIIILLFLCFKFKMIEINYVLASIGAVLAFWYGYKKYEREKEIEIIEKYLEIHNKIISELNNKKYIDKDIFDKFIDLWSKELFLYKKGYIYNELWQEWDFLIKEDVRKLLFGYIPPCSIGCEITSEGEFILKETFEEYKERLKEKFFEKNKFLMLLFEYYSKYGKNIKSKNYFYDYLIKKTKENINNWNLYFDYQIFCDTDNHGLLNKDEFIYNKEFKGKRKIFIKALNEIFDKYFNS